MTDAVRKEWSATAGASPAILGDRAVVVTSGPGAEETARRLHAAGVVEHGLDAILDEIVTGGVSALPSFAALEFVPARDGSRPAVDVSGVVRGGIRIQAQAAGDALSDTDGTGVRSWAEFQLPGVEALRLIASEATDAEAPVAAGPLAIAQLRLRVAASPEITDTVDLGLTLAAMTVHAPAVITHVAAPGPLPERAPDRGVVVLPDGAEVLLRNTLLVGRSPRSERLIDARVPDLIVLDHRDVSRTHARIDVDADRVLLEDLGSTNGTVLQDADGHTQRLRPGEPVIVSEGAVARFGNGPRLSFRGLL